MSVSLAGHARTRSAAAWPYFRRRARTGVREVPGVLSASATESLPLNVDSFAGQQIQRRQPGTVDARDATVRVAPGFFSTIGGRVLLPGANSPQPTHRPASRSPSSTTTSRRNFGDPATLVGRPLTSATAWPTAQIVGVVRACAMTVRSDTPHPQVFWPSRAPRALTIVARVQRRARDRIAVDSRRGAIRRSEGPGVQRQDDGGAAGRGAGAAEVLHD